MLNGVVLTYVKKKKTRNDSPRAVAVCKPAYVKMYIIYEKENKTYLYWHTGKLRISDPPPPNPDGQIKIIQYFFMAISNILMPFKRTNEKHFSIITFYVFKEISFPLVSCKTLFNEEREWVLYANLLLST